MKGFVVLVSVAIVIWLFLVLGLGWYVVFQKDADSTKLGQIFDGALTFGSSAWQLLQPVVQLALIFTVLAAAADHFGLADRFRAAPSAQGSNASGSGWSGLTSAQSAIAVLIVGSYVIGSLVKIGELSGLKDITLVVVGFYFGSRRPRESDLRATTEADAVDVDAQKPGSDLTKRP